MCGLLRSRESKRLPASEAGAEIFVCRIIQRSLKNADICIRWSGYYKSGCMRLLLSDETIRPSDRERTIESLRLKSQLRLSDWDSNQCKTLRSRLLYWYSWIQTETLDGWKPFNEEITEIATEVDRFEWRSRRIVANKASLQSNLAN